MMRTLTKSPSTFTIQKNCTKPARRLSLSKTFPLPKPRRFRNSPWLMLRNSASIARQISYMVHGTSVHGTSTWSISKTFPPPKPHRFKNSPCSCFATPRAQLAKFPTWYTVHGPWYIYLVHLKTFPLPKPHRFRNSLWLMLRNSASTARQISCMVHGTWSMVHERVYILASGENRSSPKRGCASISFLQPGAQPP